MPDVQVIWTDDERDGYGSGVGDAPQSAVDSGVFEVTEEVGGPRPGKYLRVDRAIEELMTEVSNESLPVFLREGWIAYTESLASTTDQGSSRQVQDIDKVRQHLHETADLAVSRGHISVSPIITWVENAGETHERLRGAVVLIRPDSVS